MPKSDLFYSKMILFVVYSKKDLFGGDTKDFIWDSQNFLPSNIYDV